MSVCSVRAVVRGRMQWRAIVHDRARCQFPMGTTISIAVAQAVVIRAIVVLLSTVLPFLCVWGGGAARAGGCWELLVGTWGLREGIVGACRFREAAV